MHPRNRPIHVLLAILGLSLVTRPIDAGTIYVDSRLGNDTADGKSASPLNSYSGPVRTLQRAERLLCPGDALVLANNGTPYYGSLSFVGPRHSGVPGLPLQVIGNGATIFGARPLPAYAWRPVDLNLWSVTPWRKTYAQLARGGETLTMYELPGLPVQLPNAPADHWSMQQGQILFKSRPVDDPRLSPLELASEEVGLTLLAVEHVVIRDVTFRHFRLDGINAHDRCREVILDNVVCEDNGRAGVAVGGTSRVDIHKCLLMGNGRHSLLITELGKADVQDSELSPEPAVAE